MQMLKLYYIRWSGEVTNTEGHLYLSNSSPFAYTFSSYDLESELFTYKDFS